jgi:hypothetical protein
MSTFKALQKHFNDVYTNDEFDYDKASKMVTNEYNGVYRIGKIKQLYEAILESNNIDELGKIYIKSGNRTYEDIIHEYNEKNGKDININTGISRISSAQVKIKRYFKEVNTSSGKVNIITWLLDDKMHMGVELDSDKAILRDMFVRQLNEFINNININKKIIRNNIMISIPNCELVSEISEDEFRTFMGIIKPYSKHEMKVAESKINTMTKEVGYFRHLMNNKELSDEDKRRKDIIDNWLGNSESMNNEL